MKKKFMKFAALISHYHTIFQYEQEFFAYVSV